VLPALAFACQNCGQPNFVAKTIYLANGFQGLPRTIRCKSCGERFTSDLIDPSGSAEEE
jgi:transcription elongation factor Elf1